MTKELLKMIKELITVRSEKIEKNPIVKSEITEENKIDETYREIWKSIICQYQIRLLNNHIPKYLVICLCNYIKHFSKNAKELLITKLLKDEFEIINMDDHDFTVMISYKSIYNVVEKAKEMNEELDLLEEPEKNKTRGRR